MFEQVFVVNNWAAHTRVLSEICRVCVIFSSWQTRRQLRGHLGGFGFHAAILPHSLTYYFEEKNCSSSRVKTCVSYRTIEFACGFVRSASVERTAAEIWHITPSNWSFMADKTEESLARNSNTLLGSQFVRMRLHVLSVGILRTVKSIDIWKADDCRATPAKIWRPLNKTTTGFSKLSNRICKLLKKYHF